MVRHFSFLALEILRKRDWSGKYVWTTHHSILSESNVSAREWWCSRLWQGPRPRLGPPHERLGTRMLHGRSNFGCLILFAGMCLFLLLPLLQCSDRQVIDFSIFIGCHFSPTSSRSDVTSLYGDWTMDQIMPYEHQCTRMYGLSTLQRRPDPCLPPRSHHPRPENVLWTDPLPPPLLSWILRWWKNLGSVVDKVIQPQWIGSSSLPPLLHSLSAWTDAVGIHSLLADSPLHCI